MTKQRRGEYSKEQRAELARLRQLIKSGVPEGWFLITEPVYHLVHKVFVMTLGGCGMRVSLTSPEAGRYRATIVRVRGESPTADEVGVVVKNVLGGPGAFTMQQPTAGLVIIDWDA